MTDFQFTEREKTRRQLETKLQIACEFYLSGYDYQKKLQIGQRAFPEVTYTHIPNQGSSGQEGALLQKMGLKPGWRDFIFLWGPPVKCLQVEIKYGDAGLSASQRKMIMPFESRGIMLDEANSVRRLMEILKSHGLKCQNNNPIEPDYRTDAEKMQQVFDMYKPIKS